MKMSHEDPLDRAAAEMRRKDALPQRARIVEADARVDDGPARAVLEQPQVDVVELERQRHAQPVDSGSDRPDVGGRGRFRPRMLERHAVQCTLRSRCEPDLLCPVGSHSGGGAMKKPRLVALTVLLAVVALVPVAYGQLLLSTNDNKVRLVNGAATVVKSPPPDTLTVIDIKAWPPKVVAELDVPGSVVGPPFSVAVSPDESLALVTANEKLDPADPTKRIPNNTMS